MENESFGNSWNSSQTRRLLLKQSGAAGAATVIGVHSFQTVATAEGSSAGPFQTDRVIKRSFTRTITVTFNDLDGFNPLNQHLNGENWTQAVPEEIMDTIDSFDPGTATKTGTDQTKKFGNKKTKQVLTNITQHGVESDADNGTFTFTITWTEEYNWVEP